MRRRVVSIWFYALASDNYLRRTTCEAPFVLTRVEKGAQRVYCLNEAAEKEGLSRGMSLADGRAVCPELSSAEADPAADRAFLALLARWAERYCPFVGFEGRDGLVLDISGAAHIFGGEEALLADLQARLARAGLRARLGLADTVGGAFALAHYGAEREIAPPGKTFAALAGLPVVALRISEQSAAGLKRLGIRSIGELRRIERAGLVRRFGAGLLLQLERALGEQPEPVVAQKRQQSFVVRRNFPEPVGLAGDVKAALEDMMERLCRQLSRAHKGARRLRLSAQRVDQSGVATEIGLARPMREKTRMARLFARGIEHMDAGFGIEKLVLEALAVEPLAFSQISQNLTPNGQAQKDGGPKSERFADLISRLGNRAGFENVQRYLPAQSHIPEKSFIAGAAAWCEPVSGWPTGKNRPLIMFPPEPVSGVGPGPGPDRRPPHHFRWRGMALSRVFEQGPERIQPEWWLDDPAWRSGTRDYWVVQTRQGRRLWLFFTPEQPAWFVHGEFA